MKKAFLVVLFVALFVATRLTFTTAQGPVLDKPSDQVVLVFVKENPVWTTEQQQLYVNQITCAVFSRHLERYISHAHDPQVYSAELNYVYSLLVADTIDWNPQSGFAVNMGRAGLVIPRMEVMLWYADGSLRWLLIGQEESIVGGQYVLLFDNFNVDENGVIHPFGMYKVGD